MKPLPVIKKSHFIFLSTLACALLSLYLFYEPSRMHDEEQIARVERKSFDVDVKTIGGLEAAHSLTIASLVRGDNCKIIYIVADGQTVEKNDILVKIDPTPFEEKIATLYNKLKEQQAYAESLQKSLAWEISQAERDEKMALFEIEASELELNKTLKGDGPLEIAKLKGAMQKALTKLSEMEGYAKDLQELEAQGFLNPIEVRNAEKKLIEDREAYETARLQYESYINHVHPMQIKKAEAAVKQAKIRQEESAKIRGHSIGKAHVELNQSFQSVENIKLQCRDAERELTLTEIRAPTPGMVVHRDEFRNGQHRKPRIGDMTLRNQALLDLPDLNKMTVKSKVREVDLCKVEIGTKASVEIDAYPELRFTGTITHIGVLALPDPTKPSDEKYFEIRILLDKSDTKARPGMTTRVTIHSAHVADALTVPIHALFHQQNKTYAYVMTNEGYEKREVLKGAHNDEVAEIKEGLSEGENVCLSIPKSLS